MAQTNAFPMISIEIKQGEHGLYYGTSPNLKGLLIAGESPEGVVAQAPSVIAELISLGANIVP